MVWVYPVTVVTKIITSIIRLTATFTNYCLSARMNSTRYRWGQLYSSPHSTQTPWVDLSVPPEMKWGQVSSLFKPLSDLKVYPPIRFSPPNHLIKMSSPRSLAYNPMFSSNLKLIHTPSLSFLWPLIFRKRTWLASAPVLCKMFLRFPLLPMSPPLLDYSGSSRVGMWSGRGKTSL